MLRVTSCLFAVTLFVSLSACKKESADTTPPEHGHGHEHGEGHHEDKHGDFEGREVVDNWKAQTGDVTVCPMSGKKFEVSEASQRFDYEGHSFVFCCANCVKKVEADPGKYLDAMVEEAGGAGDSAADSAAEPAAEPTAGE
jgi:YHS domain-containing protein